MRSADPRWKLARPAATDCALKRIASSTIVGFYTFQHVIARAVMVVNSENKG